MAKVYNSWAQNSHNTYVFQAPTGDGIPFGLYYDDGIIKKDARPRITQIETEHPSPVVGMTYTFIGVSDWYHDYENGVWTYPPEGDESGTYTIKPKPIKFHIGQVVTVYGSKEIIQPGHPNVLMEILYVARITSIYQPEVKEDGEFDESFITVICLEVKKNTTIGNRKIDTWTVDYAGRSNSNVSQRDGDYFNYVQNYNDGSKMAISGGRASFDFPSPSPYQEPFVTIGDNGLDFNVIYYYGGRFTVFEDEEKHRPWSGITVGVSHLVNVFTTITRDYNTRIPVRYGEPDEHGAVFNVQYSVSDREILNFVEQSLGSFTYEFDSGDYELYQDSQTGDPNANYVELDASYEESVLFDDEQSVTVGFFGTRWVADPESPDGGSLESFDDRYEVTGYYRQTQNTVSISDETDYEYLTYVIIDDDNTLIGTRIFPDYQNPWWPQNPVGSNGADFYTSDKYEFPDPYNFFYFKPTNE